MIKSRPDTPRLHTLCQHHCLNVLDFPVIGVCAGAEELTNNDTGGEVKGD